MGGGVDSSLISAEVKKALDYLKSRSGVTAVNGATGDITLKDYVTSLSVSGKTITYTKKDGSTGTITTQDTVYTHPSSGVTAGTYNSITVNTLGHVTAGSNVNYVKSVNGSTADSSGNVSISAAQGIMPVGAVIAYGANSNPDGYLLCNGATVSRTTYAALFYVIGTTYGSGNGSTTFNLPNLTNKFIQGSGTAGTVKSAGLPNITGVGGSSWNAGDSTFSDAMYQIATCSLGSQGWNNTAMSRLGFSASRSNSIYGASTTVQPPALTMRFYIKY